MNIITMMNIIAIVFSVVAIVISFHTYRRLKRIQKIHMEMEKLFLMRGRHYE